MKKQRDQRTVRTNVSATAAEIPPPSLTQVDIPPAPLLVRTPADDLSRSVARHWRIAALVAAAITALAWIAAAMQPKRYQASAIGAVTPISENLSPSEILRGVDSLDRRVIVASLAALAATPATRRLAQASSDYTIAAAVLPNTNLFRIEVEGADARRAAEIANRIPGVLSGQARTMYRMYSVTLISDAVAPAQPALPRVGRALATGLMAGILAGIAVAWLLDRRRRA